MSEQPESRAMSDIVWTPERGLSEPEVRGISWNNILLSDETYGSKWRTNAGVRINPTTALESTVVLACCRILAETISALPLHVYRRTANGGKEIASDIPLYKVLSFAPNSWQTKFEFFEQIVMNLCLWGNSYSQIKSGRHGAVSELLNLHPSRMDVERLENGRLRYSYTNPENGRLERYTQDQIMHIRWTAEPDGIKGMVPVEIAREAIALARACEIHASKYWANSARPGVILQTDGSLSAEAAERLRDNFERLHRGVDNAYRTAVLTNGLKVEPIGFTAEQSQFNDSRKFQSEEIARVYRLPMRLVQGESGGNPEIAGQEFVTYTLVPWLRRIESSISRSLIYNDDVFFAEFDTRGLMRGDSNSRAAYYSTMLNLGIYTINTCRALEGLPPVENGDKHFIAMNVQPLEEAVKPKQDPMAAMMGGAGGPPQPAQGGVPSLSQVKTGAAPQPAEQGEKSEPKPKEESLVEYAEGKVGRVKHIMDRGTLDLKSGEKIEVEPGKPVALVVDEETGEEVGVEVSRLKPATEKRALSQANQELYDAQEKIVAENGRWPKQGPAGAHYMEQNPFVSRGIACRNCIYFEEGGSCEIVKGSISPNAICKLWIIPEEKLSMPESRVDERGFCPTGEGGGIDNSCGTGGGSGKGGSDSAGGSGDGEGRIPTVQPSSSVPPPKPVEQKDISQLLEKIASSPDGFTLDPESAESPPDGIMVSEFTNDSKRSLKIKAADIMGPDGAAQFQRWLSGNRDLLGKDPSKFIGGWKTGDDFYIDIATRFEPDQAEQALEAGRKAGQLAVFNLGTFKETWVQYEDGDSRKPKEWDAGFARARKDSQVKQVYDPDSTPIDEEDHATELARHGKKTVRAYDSTDTQSSKEITDGWTRASAEVRRAGDGHDDRAVSGVPHLSGANGEEAGQDARSGLVQGQPGGGSAPVRGSAAPSAEVRSLISEAAAAVGCSSPRVTVCDIGNAIAAWDENAGVLRISDRVSMRSLAAVRKAATSGWTSQPNPVLHELAHRAHASISPTTYARSADTALTDEQASIAAQVSRYAAKANAREFIAEAIAGVWAGKSYSEAVVGLVSEFTNGEIVL